MVRNSYPKIVCSFCFPQQKSNFELSKFTSLKAFLHHQLGSKQQPQFPSLCNHPCPHLLHLFGWRPQFRSQLMILVLVTFMIIIQKNGDGWMEEFVLLLLISHVSIIEVTYSPGLVPDAAAAGAGTAAAGTGAAAGAGATGATGARGASGTFFSTSQLAGYTKIQGPSTCGGYPVGSSPAPKPFRKVPFWLSQLIFH